MPKAKVLRFYILPQLPGQTPRRDVHCRVTKKPESATGPSLAHRFLAGVFLRDVTAAKISKLMKNFSSQVVFLSRGPQACVPVISAHTAADRVGGAELELWEMSHCMLQLQAWGLFWGSSAGEARCVEAGGASQEGVAPSSWRWAAS